MFVCVCECVSLPRPWFHYYFHSQPFFLLLTLFVIKFRFLLLFYWGIQIQSTIVTLFYIELTHKYWKKKKDDDDDYERRWVGKKIGRKDEQVSYLPVDTRFYRLHRYPIHRLTLGHFIFFSSSMIMTLIIMVNVCYNAMLCNNQRIRQLVSLLLSRHMYT